MAKNNSITEVECKGLSSLASSNAPIVFIQSGSRNAIAALDFSPDNNRIIIAHVGTTESSAGIIELEIGSQSIVHSIDIDWIHPQKTILSHDGSVFVTLEDREDFVNEKRRSFPELMQTNVYNVVEVRDVSPDKLISMISYDASTTDFDLSHDGNLFVESRNGGLSLAPAHSEFGVGGTSLLLFEEFGVTKVNSVAFSSGDSAYYYVQANGSVSRQRFDAETLELTNTRFHILGAPFSLGNGLARLGDKGAGEPIDLVVSFNDQRLAILKSESIEIWNIRGSFLQSQAVYAGKFEPSDKISISPDGNLLSLITQDKWQLFDANNFDTLMTSETPIFEDTHVSAHAFSDDICLMALDLEHGEVGIVSLHSLLANK